MIDARFRAGLLLLGLSLLAGCGKHGASDEDAPRQETVAVPDVTVTRVEQAVIAGSLTVNGNLSGPANRDAKVSALVPGRIARLLVSEGDAVQAGQELAELENPPLLDQEKQAQAAVSQAEANAQNAQLAAHRAEDLLQRGIAARKEVEDAQTQLAVNEAALRQARAALSAAKSQAARTHLRAPFAGVVVRRFLGVGDQVDGTGAQPIVEVANIDSLELIGAVPAAHLGELKAGQQFTFQAAAQPADSGPAFNARLVAVLPAVDPASNNGGVRISIANPRHILKVGQYLSIPLPLKEPGKRLVVPKQAIYPDEAGEPRVYRVTGDQAESVNVKLGIQTTDQAEILSGVNAGDVVVLTGGYGLPNKSRVHVKQ